MTIRFTVSFSIMVLHHVQYKFEVMHIGVSFKEHLLMHCRFNDGKRCNMLSFQWEYFFVVSTVACVSVSFGIWLEDAQR
jgi:hypothetical protein